MFYLYSARDILSFFGLGSPEEIIGQRYGEHALADLKCLPLRKPRGYDSEPFSRILPKTIEIDPDDLENSCRHLVSIYWRDLYISALLIVRNPQDAEDVVQIALTRACMAIALGHKLGKPVDVSNLRGWLFVIVRHTAYNYIRQRDRSMSFSTLRKDFLIEVEGGKFSQPEALEICHESGSELLTRVNRLRKEHRDVIILRYFYNLNYKEIAHTLHLPVGSVGVYLRRGLKSLRQDMEAEGKRKEDFDVWSDSSPDDDTLWKIVYGGEIVIKSKEE